MREVLKQSLQARACTVFFVDPSVGEPGQASASNKYFHFQDYLPAVCDPVRGELKQSLQARACTVFFVDPSAAEQVHASVQQKSPALSCKALFCRGGRILFLGATPLFIAPRPVSFKDEFGLFFQQEQHFNSRSLLAQ